MVPLATETALGGVLSRHDSARCGGAFNWPWFPSSILLAKPAGTVFGKGQMRDKHRDLIMNHDGVVFEQFEHSRFMAKANTAFMHVLDANADLL